MIEEYAGICVHIVTFTVIHCNPVAINLCYSIGAARVEGRTLPLGYLHRFAEHLTARGLVKADFFVYRADSIQHACDAERSGLACQYWLLP